MKTQMLICAAVVAMAGCKGKDRAEGDKPAPEKAAAEADKGESLPSETETLALDQGESKIPATVTVPKGSTTFNDTPTTIRVDYGRAGELFGIQVQEGNEYNTNLEEWATTLAKNEYGNTNEVLEKTDSLIVWKVTREGQKEPNHKFRLLTKLGETTWVCTEGNYGGWSKEQMDRQLAACRTLAAK